jgi:hypothetical protein
MKKSMHAKRAGQGSFLGLCILLAAAIVTFQFPLSSARASDLIIPIEIAKPNFFGVGVGAYPDYLGSDDTAFGLLPMGRISIGGERYFSDPGIDSSNQMLLSFAAYNAGPAKISELRKEAEKNEP